MLDLNELNSEQRIAVTTVNGPVLCIAGAGSGKTTTLTYRVAYLIESGVNPSSILLLTFTKKAAADMLTKLSKLCTSNVNQIESGTFHHFASLILSKYGQYAGIGSKFTVIDDNDSEDILLSIKQANSSYLNKALFHNKHVVFQIISKARNLELSIKEILENNFPKYAAESKALEFLSREYAKYKAQNNMLDYDDLLEKLHSLLKEDTIRKEISEHYKYIMIDEYQDTNIVQAKVGFLLAKETNNIMVVGDDAQSIYSFRGGRISNMTEFARHFQNTKIIKLEKNYRSYGNILNGCNSLIAHSKDCIKKKLYTDRIAGNKIALVKCLSENEEAVLVAKRILQLYQLGYKLGDIAVLFRNSHFSFCLEMELAKRCIPFRKTGGPKVFEYDHIKNMLAHLRILNNPYEKISWLRILSLIDGIGLQTASKIYEQCTQQLEPFDFSNCKVKADIRGNLMKLSRLLIQCSDKVNNRIPDLLDLIFSYYLPIVKKKYPDSYQNKIKDLDQIAIISSKYSSLASLMSELLLENQDKLQEGNSDFVTLSTIHSAKGLEWKQVFIINLLEGRFPSVNKTNNNSELEEERRLMYVAMTRAKEGLTLSYPSGVWDKYSHSYLTEPSRFISEISTSNMEIWQIKY